MSVEAGEKLGQRGPIAEVASWRLSSGDGPEDDVELSEQLSRVLARLLPLREALWSLVADGYRVDWFCFLGSHATEHAAEFSRALLSDLLRVPGDLLLDIYDDYPEEDDYPEKAG